MTCAMGHGIESAFPEPQWLYVLVIPVVAIFCNAAICGALSTIPTSDSRFGRGFVVPINEWRMTGNEIPVKPESDACEFDNPTDDDFFLQFLKRKSEHCH